MEYRAHWDSPLGGITFAGTEEALTGLWFDGQKHFPENLPEEAWLPVFDTARRWLEIYFSGRAPDFTPPLRPQGSEFRRGVWRLLQEIPYGETATYGALARRLGLGPAAARAVGGAVGRNPISLLIPCHRVLGADGGLTGYAGGVERKRRLLELEGIRIRGR